MNWSKIKLFFLGMLCLVGQVKSQTAKHVQWQFQSIEIDGNNADLVFSAVPDLNWGLGIHHLENKTLKFPTFAFESSDDYTLAGQVAGLLSEELLDSLASLSTESQHTIVFKQRIVLNVPSTIVKGSVTFAPVTGKEVLPAETINFNVAVNLRNFSNPKLLDTVNAINQTSDNTLAIKDRITPPQQTSSVGLFPWLIFSIGYGCGLLSLMIYLTIRKASRLKNNPVLNDQV